MRQEQVSYNLGYPGGLRDGSRGRIHSHGYFSCNAEWAERVCFCRALSLADSSFVSPVTGYEASTNLVEPVLMRGECPLAKAANWGSNLFCVIEATVPEKSQRHRAIAFY